MSRAIFLLITIIIFVTSCSNSNDAQISRNDSVISDSNTYKYICGFTGSYSFVNIQPASGIRVETDSLIEYVFYDLWYNIIGGRVNSIEVKKDADQSSTGYKYAVATGSLDDNGNATRKIFYKTNDLAGLLTKANGWFLKAIAMHELGHHVNGDPFTGVSRDTAELGADDYAGFMLGRGLNATLDTAIMAYESLTEENPTNGYPTRIKRIAAVRAGWERSHLPRRNSIIYTLFTVTQDGHGASGNKWTKDLDDIRNAVDENVCFLPSLGSLQTDTAMITIGTAFSPGDFYIDSNYLYFKKTNELLVVGRVAKSNLSEYKTMVYDKYYNYMYIDQNNFLVTYVRDDFRPSAIKKLQTIGRIMK